MNSKEFLTPDEFDKKLEALEKEDPDFLNAIVMIEKINYIKMQVLSNKETIAKNKLKIFIFTSSVVLIFLFLKAMGYNIGDGEMFILYSLMFAWHLYAV